MKYRIGSTLLALTFFASALFGSDERSIPTDMRVVSSDASGLTIEFKPVYSARETVSTASGKYIIVGFYRSTPTSTRAGDPDVRSRFLPVALPSTRGNRVAVLSADYETEEGFPLAPMPKVVAPTDEKAMQLIYAPGTVLKNEFVPSVQAELRGVANVHGMTVGYVDFHPVQYNPATRTLRRCSRMVVRLDYGSPAPPSERPVAGKWAEPFLVNYRTALEWGAGGGSQKRVTATSLLSSGTWYKLEVQSDGMYRIDAAYLRALGVDVASIGLLSNLRIYGGTSNWLPENPDASRLPDLTPDAVRYVDQNGDGQFEEGDYVLFYGQGPTGWNYDPTQKEFHHYMNPFTNSCYYFLRIGPVTGAPKTMNLVTLGSPGQSRVDRTKGLVFFEEHRTNFVQSGQLWVSAPFNGSDSRVISSRLDGYAEGTSVRYRYTLYSRSDAGADFQIEESGVPIASLYFVGIPSTALDDPQYAYAYVGSGAVSIVPSLQDDRSNLKLSYQGNSTVATGWIGSIEIQYQELLQPVGDRLLFRSPDTSGTLWFSLSGFSANGAVVFDVSDPLNVREIGATTDQIMGSLSFGDTLSSGKIRRYWAGLPTTYATPVSAVRLPQTNLRGIDPATQFIIITQHDFVDQARQLQKFKETLTDGDALRTAVVEVDTIYNEFGFGMADPVALRDYLAFLASTYNMYPYVLLFGDASYDYLSILGNDRSWVPTYETSESMNDVDSYAYDSFFGVYHNPTQNQHEMISIPIGRIAVRSPQDASQAVDRIIQYESHPTLGAWKNLVTIVADDRNVYGMPDVDNPGQAELLANRFTPPSYEIKKIYENDYPSVSTSSGRRKPAVHQAILDQVNRGTLLLNYTGHGNPKVWSHESILTIDDVETQFNNAGRLCFVVAATCDWARYDAAGSQSSAEEMMATPAAGAIGVFAATRPVFSNENGLINQELYSYLLPASPYTRVPRLGDASMMAKNDAAGSDVTNERKYNLLGDPTLRLEVPDLVMTVDSINGTPVSAAVPETLKALSKVTVEYSVRDSSGNIEPGINGTALVEVYDADQVESTVDLGLSPPDYFNFLKPGGLLYRGDNSIRDSRMQVAFIVPKDIAYANKNGRIAAYFSGAGTDGRGFTKNVIVGGTSTSAANDGQGPKVSIYLDNRSFRSGDLVGDHPNLIVDLDDSSGINTAGSGIGHRIEAWIDDSTQSIDLTDFYEGKTDSYQQGTVQYALSALSGGTHTLRVKAWDSYNNSASAQVTFSVASSDGLTIANVFNFPDPVRRVTAFTFQHNQLSPIDVHIKVYTVAGRLIQTLDAYGVANRFVSIPWDCRDRDGDLVGNGTYLYKVVASTVDGRFASEALGKLSVVR